MSRATSDRWPERWLPLIGERAGGLAILEVGCGGGRDTEVLAGAGYRVVAIDLSPDAIAKARARAPQAQFHCQDIRAAFPVDAAGVVRFFDRAAVDRLFSSGWRMLGAEERIIDRYERPKSAWEVVLEKAP